METLYGLLGRLVLAAVGLSLFACAALLLWELLLATVQFVRFRAVSKRRGVSPPPWSGAWRLIWWLTRSTGETSMAGVCVPREFWRPVKAVRY